MTVSNKFDRRFKNNVQFYIVLYSEYYSTLIITKILLGISVKIWKMLENVVVILCVNFKPNRKGTPFQINTYL